MMVWVFDPAVPLAGGAWEEGAPVVPAATDEATEGAVPEEEGAELEGGADSPAPPY